MELIFAETENRYQCGSEVVVNDLKIQCTFSTSRVVTIPAGLQYVDGNLDFSRSALSSTISICKNHENRLKNVFRDLLSSVK